VDGQATLADVAAAAIAAIPNPVPGVLLSTTLAGYEDAEHRKPSPRTPFFTACFFDFAQWQSSWLGRKCDEFLGFAKGNKLNNKEGGCGILHQPRRHPDRLGFPLELLHCCFCDKTGWHRRQRGSSCFASVGSSCGVMDIAMRRNGRFPH
jgi:hypothetical protein